jgi:hypothetical protein
MLLDVISQTYQSRSKNIDNRELINFYPEFEGQLSKNIKALIGTPGLRKIITINSGVACRGLYTTSTGRMFGVTNTEFWELNSDETKTTRGTISSTDTIINFTDNGNELLFVDGTTGYILDLTTNVLTDLTGSGGFPVGPTHCVLADGYFLVNEGDSGNVFFSGLYDGMSWNALDFFNAEFSADNLQGITKNSSGNIWLLGKKSYEIWQHTGSSGLQFQRVNGAQREFGTIAPYSISSNGSEIFFIGSDAEGFGSVFMGTGYDTKMVSTPAIAYQLGKITNLEDAEGYTYSIEGHKFYIINLGNEATYCYDVNTNLWHKRGTWNSQTGYNLRQRVRGITFFNNKYYVGDYSNAILYHLDPDYYSEDETDIKRVIITPHINNENKRIFFNNFQIDFEKGVGNSDIDDPTAILSYSNDGGYTFSNDIVKKLGEIGEYYTRVKWNRLGSGRDRVFKIICSDQAKYIIVNVYYNEVL